MSQRHIRMLLAVLGIGVALGATELALQLEPRLLPASYLAHFPGHGTEFFRAGVFERTPVEGVLLPHLAGTKLGPPPADLIELGIAPATELREQLAFPRVHIPADELGFPNLSLPERADLVLLGDSFGVACGVVEPESLQGMLARRTGLTLFNASIAGIGPAQERWLLETVVLPRAPRAVVWLFFGGNDLTGSFQPWLDRRAGHATWAEAHSDQRRPGLILPDLLRHSLASKPPKPCPEPLPGFEFELADGGARPIWFESEQLRQVAWSVDEWRNHPVWAPVQGELVAARDACAARGAKLVLVYIPSAPELYLPFVRPAAELVARTLAATGGPGPTDGADATLARMLANRRALETLVHEFCAGAGIPFLSATPALTVQASEGTLGYLATDTHWTSVGQAALVEPLLELLRSEDLLP